MCFLDLHLAITVRKETPFTLPVLRSTAHQPLRVTVDICTPLKEIHWPSKVNAIRSRESKMGVRVGA